MKKQLKKTSDKEIINLHGYRIQLLNDKVIFFNDQKININLFKKNTTRLMQYLIDENFLPNRSIKVKIITDK